MIWGFWLENIGRNLGMHPGEDPSVSNSLGGLLAIHSPVCSLIAEMAISLLPGRFNLANLNFNSSSPMSRFPWKAWTRMVPSKQTDFLWTRNFFPWMILLRKDLPWRMTHHTQTFRKLYSLKSWIRHTVMQQMEKDNICQIPVNKGEYPPRLTHESPRICTFLQVQGSASPLEVQLNQIGWQSPCFHSQCTKYRTGHIKQNTKKILFHEKYISIKLRNICKTAYMRLFLWRAQHTVCKLP